MKINSETKVYEAYLYKDNSIKISEFDGDVGLTAIGDTEEEAAHY